tara:strand:+ start:209 stop:790 length:582 start_codon:yes stop_codon:yes gene_type:complete
MPIRFRGPVKPKKLKSPDPINMPVVRNDKVPKIKSDVLYYKENGSLPTEPEGDFNPSDFYTDPVTGLKWLRMVHTDAVSIDEATSDPKYTGLRLATQAEVEELLANYFGRSFAFNNSGPSERLSAEERQNWQDTFGITGTASAGNSYGTWIDEDGTIRFSGARNFNNYMYHGYAVGSDTSTARDQDGVFLVQE